MQAVLVRYTVGLPLPGSPELVYFENKNITDFLKRYEDMCEDSAISEVERIRRLPRYCEMLVGQTLQGLDSYSAKKWDPLVEELKKKYKAGDYPWGDFDCLYRPIRPIVGILFSAKKVWIRVVVVSCSGAQSS